MCTVYFDINKFYLFFQLIFCFDFRLTFERHFNLYTNLRSNYDFSKIIQSHSKKKDSCSVDLYVHIYNFYVSLLSIHSFTIKLNFKFITNFLSLTCI